MRRIEVCLEAIQAPGFARGLRETSGPTQLEVGEVADGQLLRRAAAALSGADIWDVTRPDSQVIYVDAAGDDEAPGALSTPIQSRRELDRRIALGGEDLRVFFGAGTFKGHDYQGAGLLGNRSTWGSFTGRVTLEGAKTASTVLTVSSSSQSTATINVSETMVVDEHAGKFFLVTVGGVDLPVRVISNTTGALLCAVGASPSLPTSGSLQLYTSGTIIAPPDTNPTSAPNRVYIAGSGLARYLQVTGGFAGMTALHAGTQWTLLGCGFSGQTTGLDASGYVSAQGCLFDTHTTGVVAGVGRTSLNNCLFRSCSVGGLAQFTGSVLNLSANSLSSFKTVTQALFAKTGGLVNDETVRTYINAVQDYYTLSRGGKVQKVNASLTGLSGAASPTRNVVRMVGGGNICDLLDSNAQNLTPGGSYFHIDGSDISLASYLSGGADYEATKGNRVFDGHDP